MIYVLYFAVEDVVHVDECGVNAHYQREYGRAKAGRKVEDTKRGKRFKRTNIIAGLWGKRHVAVQCYVFDDIGFF